MFRGTVLWNRLNFHPDEFVFLIELYGDKLNLILKLIVALVQIALRDVDIQYCRVESAPLFHTHIHC